MKLMKHLVIFGASTLATVLAFQGTASAQLLSAARCQNAFSVSEDTAQRRYAWSLFCKANPGPDAAGMTRPGTHYLTDQSVTDYNTASSDPGAAVNKQHLFPTYFDFVGGGLFDIPATSLTSLAVPTATPPASPAACLTLPTSAINVGLCVAGCYVEGTQLQFADGPMAIKTAAEALRGDLVTLSPDATLDNLSLTTNKVERYTTDVTESVQTIYTLTMASGGQLKVTNEHPLLDGTGVIRQAHALKVGDNLVRANGKQDPITSIAVNKIFGKVYNVRPVTTDYVSNIVVAGGYLNGSLRYQNEFLDTVNALILRRALADQADKVVTH